MALETSTAPELTQEQVQRILVQPLAERSVFLAAGPRIFDTTGSPVRVPKMAPPISPSWHGQNEQIAEVDPDFGEVTLLPDTMKSVKTLVKFSNELARQSVVSLDAALRDRLVTDVAATLDTAFIASSTSDGTQPLGILNYAGRQSVTGVGAVALDPFLDAWGLALSANVNMGSLRWMVRPETFTALRKLKDSQNRYQLVPDPTQDAVFRLFGAPVTVTSRIPTAGSTTVTTKAVLADFGQVAVARDTAPTVKVLDQTFGDFDQMALRVVARYDAKPLNPEAVVTLEGITV